MINLGILGLWVLQGCASIVPPSGGPKDTSTPVLLSEQPKDSLLNSKVSKIELRFNKFMEVHKLNKQMTTSPLLPISPTVVARKRRVTITLPDSVLQPNTTYRIALGNALTDNREQTPYPNFTYTFSTGSYFDSLALKGTVIDAKTGLPDSSATIFLYPANLSDSAVIRKPPMYIAKTNATGAFEFKMLPKKSFRAFAVTDKDNNHIYTPNDEKVDFYDTIVVPSAHPDTLLHFAVFKEAKDTLSKGEPKTNSKNNRFSNRFGSRGGKKQLGYRVLVDTQQQKVGTFDLNSSLKIQLNQPLKAIDSPKIFLSYDDKGIAVEALCNLLVDSTKILIKPKKWHPDKTYTLRLIKGWAIDTAGLELAPGKYTFHTKPKSDYATLNLHPDPKYRGNQFLFVLFQKSKVIWKGPADSSKITIPLLNPGSYHLRMVFDKNKNGHWDSGNLFERQHAEKVIPYKGEIIMKAGWVNDIDFKVNPKKEEQRSSRFSKRNSQQTEKQSQHQDKK